MNMDECRTWKTVSMKTIKDEGLAGRQVGHVETRPGGRRRGHLPNPLFSNISQHCAIGGEKVSEHLQMGPGEGYMFSKDKHSFSLSHTQ